MVHAYKRALMSKKLDDVIGVLITLRLKVISIGGKAVLLHQNIRMELKEFMKWLKI